MISAIGKRTAGSSLRNLSKKKWSKKLSSHRSKKCLLPLALKLVGGQTRSTSSSLRLLNSMAKTGKRLRIILEPAALATSDLTLKNFLFG